jgi:hypothetical protein
MSAANCGRGQCAEVLDSGRQCTAAAYGEDLKCYFHGKLARGLGRRWRPEPLTAPAPKKAKVAK